MDVSLDVCVLKLFPDFFSRLAASGPSQAVFRLTALLGAWQHTLAKSVAIGGNLSPFSEGANRP
jgi:hypothetical protein